ncbi:hypothetical protein BLNAU_5959 [Blattamonas nauphoetae]|uniref:Saposin B-type domain-containing protein n=1 Tax=Blattamonas nauphoetae TaxID=2049346 RepID=A0ABQ9Y634_9EUKA|nr:hypothetical protein BLNAU_5959 [Blattamonas nauphoetae]
MISALLLVLSFGFATEHDELVSNDNGLCEKCQTVVGKFESYIVDTVLTPLETNLVEHVCSILPAAIRETCEETVTTHFDEMIAKVKETYDPVTFCTKYKLCKATSSQLLGLAVYFVVLPKEDDENGHLRLVGFCCPCSEFIEDEMDCADALCGQIFSFHTPAGGFSTAPVASCGYGSGYPSYTGQQRSPCDVYGSSSNLPGNGRLNAQEDYKDQNSGQIEWNRRRFRPFGDKYGAKPLIY